MEEKFGVSAAAVAVAGPAGVLRCGAAVLSNLSSPLC